MKECFGDGVRDLVTSVIRRLGVAGAILIASVVFFAALGGAVVVHRLQTASTATVHEKGETAERDDQGEEAGQHRGQSKPKHPNHGHNHGSKPAESDSDND